MIEKTISWKCSLCLAKHNCNCFSKANCIFWDEQFWIPAFFWMSLCGFKHQRSMWVCGCGCGCMGVWVWVWVHGCVGVGVWVWVWVLMYFLMKGIQVVQWTETAAWKCIISPQQGGSTGFLFHCKQWNISQGFIRSRSFWDTIRNLPDWDQHAPLIVSNTSSVTIKICQYTFCAMFNVISWVILLFSHRSHL